jgi:anti-anti-sigma factor
MTFTADIAESSTETTKILVFHGELDESYLEDLKKQLDPILDDANIKSLIFDLHDLEFINSKGIGFIVSIHTHLAKDKRTLILIDAQEAVMDVVSLVGLTSIIPYYSSLEEALNNV